MFSDPNTSGICQPIRLVDAVLSWEPPKLPNWANKVVQRTARGDQCFKGMKQCRTEVTPFNKIPRHTAPKTLYCHDMAGGYLNDKDVLGNDKSEGFEFFRWSCVDIFVYFSHNLVTIPPLGWINAAHKNGVTVLGTLITEGTKGERIWSKLLSSLTMITKFTTALAKICEHYGFDGYLINVENSIQSDKMELFSTFITLLRRMLKSNDPSNLLIWYDSVVFPTGLVSYQNALNKLNKHFFDLTDAIFLNYTWSEADLEVSLVNAGARNLDVFVGVDVFGRGCKGGGGFGTVEAVDSVRKKGLSIALFAPGWVYECSLPGEQFLSRDYKFWDYLCEYLYVSGPSQLPFYTTFSLGRGKKFFENGKMVDEKPWYDLSKQDYQISGLIGSYGIADSCLSYYDEDGFNGGGCLLVKSCPSGTQDAHVDRLFVCDFPMETGDKLIFRITTKPLIQHSKPVLFIIVSVEENGADKSICLEVSDGSEDVAAEGDNPNVWISCDYMLEPPSRGRVFEIGCMLAGDKSPLLIGQVHIMRAAQLAPPLV